MKIDIDFTRQLELKIKLPKQPKLPKVPSNKYYRRKMKYWSKKLPSL